MLVCRNRWIVFPISKFSRISKMKRYLTELFKTEVDRFLEGARDLADLERRQMVVRDGFFCDHCSLIANLQAGR